MMAPLTSAGLGVYWRGQIKWGRKMSRHVVAMKFDSALQDYVPIPLDDADQRTIDLANLVHGKNLSEADFDRLVTRNGGVDISPKKV